MGLPEFFCAFNDAVKKSHCLCPFIHQRYSEIYFSLLLKCHSRIRYSSFPVHHFSFTLIHKPQKNVNKIVCDFFS